MDSRIAIALATIVVGGVLGGCNVGPDPRTPDAIAFVTSSTVRLWYPKRPLMTSGTWLDAHHLITTRHGTACESTSAGDVMTIFRPAQGGSQACPIVAMGKGAPMTLETSWWESSKDQMLRRCRDDWMVLAMPPSEIPEERPVSRRGTIAVGDRILISGWPALPGVPSADPRTVAGRVERLHPGGVFEYRVEHGPTVVEGMSGGPIFKIDTDEPILVGIVLGTLQNDFMIGLFPWWPTRELGLTIPWNDLPTEPRETPKMAARDFRWCTGTSKPAI